MQLQGSFDSVKPVEEVCSILKDLREIVPCMPDLQDVRFANPQQATVKVKAGVGFVKGVMTIRLSSNAEAEQIRFQGQGSGMGSAVELDARFIVSPLADSTGGSRVDWQGEARVSGSLASLGGGLIEVVARKQVEKLIGCLESRLANGIE